MGTADRKSGGNADGLRSERLCTTSGIGSRCG